MPSSNASQAAEQHGSPRRDPAQGRAVPDVQRPSLDQTGEDGNSASTLIEAPLKPGQSKLRRHDFPDGGGSGGAEAFRRSKP